MSTLEARLSAIYAGWTQSDAERRLREYRQFDAWLTETQRILKKTFGDVTLKRSVSGHPTQCSGKLSLTFCFRSDGDSHQFFINGDLSEDVLDFGRERVNDKLYEIGKLRPTDGSDHPTIAALTDIVVKQIAAQSDRIRPLKFQYAYR